MGCEAAPKPTTLVIPDTPHSDLLGLLRSPTRGKPARHNQPARHNKPRIATCLPSEFSAYPSDVASRRRRGRVCP
ncbi:hypothetical protein C1Y26_02760 [Pseudomonas sp. MPR-R2A7]|nr:hypothetical protein C1Y23_07935 [Pseudomonas sp. GW460-12]PMX35852.1 hypothetical protein C1Y24_08535 [Pseudomonas sp. MPR-R2A4]PMX43509.1 hypothetical protein C1Y26_02760 [Pseudomonas sp. MPR-R2A7]PMX55193.1 hypothetical protein C1Y17_04575 [Pseudomonas sp. MPR-R2A6]PMX92647.1 hypothetical protein C1Y21_06270 [Pseudomonas sp. MPR-R2A3]PMY15969.1 hypothetical protein C1Y22_03655 [Pseudomonas sp. MPR-R2A5]PNA35126.1 hypothetical protein C1Y16_10120 [Pseudomonas sp. MPR-ANB1]PNA49001.1 hyp